VLPGNQILTKTQFYVESGDFLVSNRQISHGACGVVPPALSGSIVSNEYTVLHTTKLLDPDFLQAMAHSVYFQQTCFHSSIGVTVEKLVFRLDEWMKREFDIPGHEEQRRIASLLAQWDQAIQQTERLIAAQHIRRKAISRLLFQQPSSMQTRKARGKLIEIGQMANCFSGGTPDRRERTFFGGGIPWVKSGEIVSAHIAATEETLSEKGLASSAAKWVPAGSTLIAMYGANAGQVGRLDIDATTNQAILAIVPNKSLIAADYMYHAVVSVIPSLMRKLQGSGQPNLSAGIVKAERIWVPNIEDQAIIAKIATVLEEAESNLHAQLIKLRVQKRGLIQKLLSGEWRLPGTPK
jgi:type I restriction enzyme S subunit